MKTFIIWLIFTSILSVACSAQDAPIALLKKCKSLDGNFAVWWLEPTSKDWKTFNFSKISREKSLGIFKLFKRVEYRKDAADFVTIDSSHLNKSFGKQGLLIFVSDGGAFGFRRRRNMIYKNGLQPIRIDKFIPKKSEVLWATETKKYGFGGVYLTKSFDELMAD